jgi:hypothetical protein
MIPTVHKPQSPVVAAKGTVPFLLRQKSGHSPVDPLEGPQALVAEFWGDDAPADLIRQRALDWMRAIAMPVASVEAALEAIAWAQGLTLLAKILDPADFSAFSELLCRVATEADASILPDRPLLHQLLAGELALTLAARLPDVKPRRRMEKSGRAAVTLGLGQVLGMQGVPAAEHFHFILPLLACWTRCGGLAKESSDGAWGPRAQQKFDRFVRNVLRITRPDGEPMLAANDASEFARKILDAAVQLSADAANRQIAAVALTPISGKVPARPKKSLELPPASLNCEESGMAVLRRGWNRDEERLVARFAGHSCEIELVASGKVAMSGEWPFGLSRQGQPLEPVSNWESICWHSDADVDYLELQIELADGVILQRHLVLAREDRLLLLADAVLGTIVGGLEYCGILPLAGGVEFRPAAETREGLLISAKSAERGATSKVEAKAASLAQVMPFNLPEWRSDSSIGQLIGTARGLELHQETEGRRLFAPLLIDLDRARFRRRLTWRTLTVAASLLPVPAELAVGYRIALGQEQWLIYRSLGPVGNRTLLGHNLSTETLVARFDTDGEITPIIEIE